MKAFTTQKNSRQESNMNSLDRLTAAMKTRAFHQGNRFGRPGFLTIGWWLT
jgi:hypothetical protein